MSGDRSTGNRIKGLARRHNYLAKRILKSDARLTFDEAEASNLEWAIVELCKFLGKETPTLVKWRPWEIKIKELDELVLGDGENEAN